MITVSPMWEITTSVGIPMEPPNPKSGALQLILKFSHSIAPSHFVPHRRLLTSHWTVMINLTRTTVTRTHLWRKKTFLPLSQSALLSWLRHGLREKVHTSLFFAMTKESSALRESRFSRILENFFEISLLDLDLESFLFHFHFSISISSHFHFTFISRKEWKGQKFHPFSREKRVKFYTKFHEKFNHSSIEGEEPKTNYVRNNEWRYPTVHSRYDNK